MEDTAPVMSQHQEHEQNLEPDRRHLSVTSCHRWPSLLLQDLVKEAFGRSRVSVACDQVIGDIALLVHGPPKIMTFAADRDEQLVHVPDVAETTLSPPQNPRIRRVIAEAECCR